MANNAEKHVERALLDTWTEGVDVASLLNDRSDLAQGADSFEIPEDQNDSIVVNLAETGSSQTLALASPNTVLINRPMSIFRELSHVERDQLLGGNDRLAQEIARSDGGRLKRRVDRDLIEHCFEVAALADHVNIGGTPITDNMVNDIEGAMLDQPGVDDSQGRLVWLANPRACGGMKSVAEYAAQAPDIAQGGAQLGLPPIITVNGSRLFRHSGVRLVAGDSATESPALAGTVTSNVMTMTGTAAQVARFRTGMRCYTTGFTNNVAQSAPQAITVATSTTITIPLTTANGSQGTGVLRTADFASILIDRQRYFYGANTPIAMSRMVAGKGSVRDELQLFKNIGRLARAGSVKIVWHGNA